MNVPAAEIAAARGVAAVDGQSRSDGAGHAARAGQSRFIKSLIGLNELGGAGEDARTKQLREIQQLLSAAPIALAGSEAPGTPFCRMASGKPPIGRFGAPREGQAAAIHFISTVPVDELLDDHATEFEECRRWASSDAGQLARAQNPAALLTCARTPPNTPPRWRTWL